jgi:DNA-directed RNA polymerase subunit RPC12/RpoP
MASMSSELASEEIICTRCKRAISVTLSELFVGHDVTCPSCGHQQALAVPMPAPRPLRSRTTPPIGP